MAKHPKPPFDPNKLPKAVRSQARTALRRWLGFQEVHDALQAHFGDDEPDGESLVAQAFCVFEEGCTVMVDEVIVRGEQALELLDRAKAAGFPAARAKALRARIRRLLRQERARIAKVEALLDADPADLSTREVGDLAMLLSEKLGAQQQARAAALWGLLEGRGHGYDPGYCRARRGLCLWRSGEHEAARPLLEELIAGQVRTGSELEHSFLLLAANLLLEHAIAAGDPQPFASEFHRLRTASRAMNSDRAFPMASAVRGAVRRAATEWGLADVLDVL